MNIDEAIQDAKQRLDDAGVGESRRDAKTLLRFALERDAVFLAAHPEYVLTAAEVQRFRELIARRSLHEPVQYILGKAEFYALEFTVSPAVLIPRPETEHLVEAAIELLSPLTDPRFCEIGVGSGCISISVLANVPHATGIAVDISPEALAVAAANRERLNVAERLELRLSDLFDAVAEDGFDAILSNPPYVSAGDYRELETQVRDHEPKLALTDNADGLEIIERIIPEAYHKLRSGGVLLLEIGIGQSELVGSLFAPDKWTTVQIHKDLRSIPRVVRAQRR